MKPNSQYINVTTDENIISDFIEDIILTPRLKILKWSNLTKQTPALKISYTAQHLASLITGVEGSRTAARGDDLADGSEVKGCTRTDQLDTCKTCKNKVLRLESECAFCVTSKPI